LPVEQVPIPATPSRPTTQPSRLLPSNRHRPQPPRPQRQPQPLKPVSTPTTTATATGTVEPTSTATETATPTPTGTPTPANQVTYTYDGDGNLVMSEVGSTVTFYPNMYYEIQGTIIIKYYFAAGKRIAMREDGTVTFLLADHLGSTSVTTDSTGVLVSSMLYTAFGETRSSTGMTTSDYRYTGQREESEIGLYFYIARWYDSYLNRFLSSDTIDQKAEVQFHF